jgi:hypothetical protein
MASNTSRLNLYKPADDGSEFVDVSSDLNQNLDKLDAAIGFIPATSSTPPTTTFAGMARQDTDTSRTYYRNGSDSAWNEILNSVGVFGNDVKVASGKKLGIGTSAPLSIIDVVNPNTTDVPLRFRQTADTIYRAQLNWNGIEFGPGNAARDVFVYRSGVGTLNIDATVAVSGALNVGGTTTLGDTSVTGDLSLTGSVSSDLTVNGTFQANGIGGRWVKYKPADQSRQSITTPTNDTDLTVALLANATYIVRFYGIIASPSTADFRTAWSVPSGATGLKYCLGPNPTATSRDATTMRTGAHGHTTQVDYGLESPGFSGIQEHGVVSTGATAGNMSIQWAQVASVASNTTMGIWVAPRNY